MKNKNLYVIKDKSPLRIIPRTRLEEMEYYFDWLDKIDKGDYTESDREEIRKIYTWYDELKEFLWFYFFVAIPKDWERIKKLLSWKRY